MSAPASDVRLLADELAARLLRDDPVTGSSLGLREYDALLPDPSTPTRDALARDLAAFDARAARLTAVGATDRVTLAVIRATCARQLLQLEIGADRYTASAMPIAGPPALFALAARTTLPDDRAASDYLARLHGMPAVIDAGCVRLQEGRAAGRLPVGSLTDQAIAWADRMLATPLPPALVAPVPPADLADVAGWREQVEAAITSGVVPALVRWRSLLASLRAECRSDDRPGLVALPGGDELYRRCIAVHTTLERSADDLHEIGRAAITTLSDKAIRLGASIGLTTLAEVVEAVRASGTSSDQEQALLDARTAVARAEARAHEIMPPPLPDPCAVEAMPPTVAESGMAPHYTRPRADRPGTFWFNTVRATAGTGWDLEAVAFHEAVPGHHSQLARLQRLEDLPLLQQFSVTVHSEGWGLYAERLADEFGLYSSVQAQLGSVYIEMHRAARLVVDTGLHAHGWSRDRAVQFMVEHVALPEQFLADEVDRYIAWPGQALAYLSGQREILRMRAAAERELGPRFDLPGFHAALLDSGSLPMSVLETVVEDWVASRH